MALSGKVSLKVKMTILIIEILIIGLYGVVVGAKNMGTIRNDAKTGLSTVKATVSFSWNGTPEDYGNDAFAIDRKSVV